MHAQSRNACLIPGLMLAAITLWPALGDAQEDSAKKLQEVEETLKESKERQSELAEKADAAQREIRAISRELVKRTQAVQDAEEAVSLVEDRIADLVAEENQQAAALEARSAKMAETLAALQRLSQRPPELMLARPDEAVDTVRSATLLKEALPALKEQAANLQRAIVDIRELRTTLGQERETLSSELSGLRERVERLDKIKARRQALQRALMADANQEARRVRVLTAEAETLRSLLEKIERDRRARKPGAPDLSVPGGQSFASARGALVPPARGPVVQAFGAKTEAGASRGIRIQTRAGAQVVAPFDGRVVFSGPFRSYGQLLIIGHGEGYHTLIAGMARIEATAGQWILAGEPVGVMASMAEDSAKRLAGNQAAGKPDPELYLEIRHNGEPVNPGAWLASGNGKVGG